MRELRRRDLVRLVAVAVPSLAGASVAVGGAAGARCPERLGGVPPGGRRHGTRGSRDGRSRRVGGVVPAAPVNERLPDEELLRADEIELVDMSPYALRQRMKHGNVYPAERARVALEKFFTEGNLTALRELALRLVAQRVEGQLETTTAGSRLPLVTERVLVLVDGSPASLRAIRRAAKLAGALRGAFVAVVVNTPEVARMPFDRSHDLQEAVDDAVDLGADIVRVSAADEAAGIVQIARARRATHVVLPFREASGLARLRRHSIAERVVRLLPEVDVHVIAAKPR